MADSAAELDFKRLPGRPKGLPKTGGRQKGVGNRPVAELARYINQRGRPLEFLAAIASGRKVSVADPADPGRKVNVYPSLPERAAAARTLLSKILPDLKSQEITGDPDRPVTFEPSATGLSPEVELARRIVFLLNKAKHEAGEAVTRLDEGATLLAAAEFREASHRDPEPEIEPVPDPAPPRVPPEQESPTPENATTMPFGYSYDPLTGAVYRDGKQWRRITGTLSAAGTLTHAVRLARSDMLGTDLDD